MTGALRPHAVSGRAAGAGLLGGWIAPDGRFYTAAYLHHIRIAAALRAAGHGPTEPWTMRDGWVMIRAHGEVVALPDRLTQAQLDTLGDMLLTAPAESRYRAELAASLRQLHELELGLSS